MTKISIVIPCLNEEKAIGHTLSLVPKFVYEVIVVDNGSTDRSIAVAKKYNVKILIEKDKGYGAAILKGLYYARGDFIVTIDGDGSYPIQNLSQMFEKMQALKLDFISGCRFPLNNYSAMPPINIFANYFISFLIRILFNINIKDSQSGMMIMHRDILARIGLVKKGMGFSQEIKIKLWLDKRFKCAEVHIPYYPRIGKVKFNKIRDSMGNLMEVLIFWWGLKNKHN